MSEKTWMPAYELVKLAASYQAASPREGLIVQPRVQ